MPDALRSLKEGGQPLMSDSENMGDGAATLIASPRNADRTLCDPAMSDVDIHTRIASRCFARDRPAWVADEDSPTA